IGRFASADTIVPDSVNPQAYNRYTYVLNNALSFNDPSGHCATEDSECTTLRDEIEGGYDLSIEGIWRLDELQTFYSALLQYVEWIGGFNKFNGRFQTIYMQSGGGFGVNSGCYNIEACGSSGQWFDRSQAGSPSDEKFSTMIGVTGILDGVGNVATRLIDFRKVIRIFSKN
ncbi:MAG: hypothetical protein KAG20_11000, partial [Cocleimonas sp.]|nr:hypothetical protein [Cocleimonas sp.]